MKKSLIFIQLGMTLLVGSYTKVNADTITISPTSNSALMLAKVNYTDVKSTFGITYNWTTDRVNFRTKPNLAAEIIKTLDKRTKVSYISEDNGWTKIKCGVEVGYIYSEYLTDKELFVSKMNRWGIELTDDEIGLLAKIVWLESRSQKDIGEQAVVECVLNRMISLDYPDTLEGVLSQTGHFVTWNNRNNAEPTDMEIKNINKVLSNETDILTFKYVYFSTSPRTDTYIKIGQHYFCKE